MYPEPDSAYSRDEFYVIVYFVNICVDDVQVNFCCVEYD